MQFFLPTPRLVIRSYRHDDAQALAQAKTESFAELNAWLEWAQGPSTVSIERQTISFFKTSAAQDKEYALALCERDGTFIGGIGYTPRNRKVPEFEIGYWLSTRHTGHGYMAEAVTALTEHLFTVQKANRIFISCQEKNLASAKVAQTVGYLFEGTMRNESRNNKGELVNMHLFALTPADWPPPKG